ncbi:MAG TPA: hypothetical protein VGE76_12290 [Opitutaceae bacterium]
MPLHVAITRRARPGCEVELEHALREFLKASFAHPAVSGANLLLPAPGSGSREFGILRTFRDERERAEFYRSPLFLAWDAEAQRLTEGEPQHRELHGLEGWFRGAARPPARWRMALVTFAGVYPLTSLLPPLFGRVLQPLHPLLINVVVTGLIVVSLTWLIMPVLTRVLRGWLHSD